MVTPALQLVHITKAPSMAPIHTMETRHVVAIVRVSVDARARSSASLRGTLFRNRQRR
jgi:hypothetical protein